jgi:acyl-CoA synthetase (AMP-forming)/AMP-acid ligase II
MDGLMQDVPLTIELMLARAETVGADVEVVSVQPAGTCRTSWGEVAERARRLAAVLDELGVAPGACVGTFAWNTRRHLELYFGVPTAGRVLHTANVRLAGDDVRYVIEHAGDQALFVDASLTPTLAPILTTLDVDRIVVMEDGADVDPAFEGCPRYEQLLAAAEPRPAPPAAEHDAASVCFTSGTTGRPKAVVYSHRSIVLHSFGSLGVDSHAISRRDVLLPLTPMFHVNCWGLPYTAALAAAKLVLPGRDTSPEHFAELVQSERVTVAAGVPTLWVRFLEELENGTRDLSSLTRVLSGGAESPKQLIDRYLAHGISYFHGWGATEMSPSGTAAVIRPGENDERWGPAVAGVELRLRDKDGSLAPWDGASQGEVEARGPWVASAYYEPEDDANATRFTDDGWFRTGDVARIDPGGALEIVDRTKDLIKSGGEWISSLELERAILEHPDVAEAAVIAVPHDEWGERPAAIIVTNTGIDPEALRRFLRDRVASWWLPEVVEVVDELPRTGVGKYDKRALRLRYAERLRPAGGDG